MSNLGNIEPVHLNKKLPLNYAAVKSYADRFLKYQVDLPPLHRFKLHKAIVSPYGSVAHRGFLYPFSWKNLTHPGQRNKLLSLYKKQLTGKKIKIDSPCLYIINSMYDNYFHWLIECLPKLMLYKAQWKELTLVMPAKLEKFHTYYLSLFQFKEIVYLKDDQIAELKEVHLCDSIHPGGEFYPALIEAFAQEILSKVPHKETGIDKIYISRAKAKTRKLIDEEKIIQPYLELGYTKVYLEDYTNEEQIHLFRNSSHIAGVHGAGMSNIIYCTKGKLLTDYINEADHSSCFYNLANIKGMDYDIKICQSYPTKMNPQFDDLKVKAL